MPFLYSGLVFAQEGTTNEGSAGEETVYEYDEALQIDASAGVIDTEKQPTSNETDTLPSEAIKEVIPQEESSQLPDMKETDIHEKSLKGTDTNENESEQLSGTTASGTILEQPLVASGETFTGSLHDIPTTDEVIDNLQDEPKEENPQPLLDDTHIDTEENELTTIQSTTVYEDTGAIEKERTETTTILKKGTITVILPANLNINTAQGEPRTFDQLTIDPLIESSTVTEKTVISREILEAEDDSISMPEDQSELVDETTTEKTVISRGVVEAENDSISIAEGQFELVDEPVPSPESIHEDTIYEYDNTESVPSEPIPSETAPADTTPLEPIPLEPIPSETTPLPQNEIVVSSINQQNRSGETPAMNSSEEEPGPTRKPAIEDVFEFGIPGEHLIFSEAVLIDYVVPFPEGAKVAILVQHAGDPQPGTVGLSTMNTTTCSPTGESSAGGNIATVQGGKIQFLTCGASTFTVTYTGGANFDNFVDASSTGKVITVTSGDIAPGSTIQDVNVIVDFWKIDGENPATPGAGQAYSDEISFVLQSPLGTIVNLMTVGTYTNTANANRVTVTFDDSAGSPPTNLPVTGTFLPTDNLSGFKFEDPIGDWLFTFADSVAQDGLILFSVSLEINAQELCGNGTLNIGEGCDDGNTTNGDGCSLACNVENGYACNSSSPGLTGNLSCNSGICDTSESPDTCEAANSCGNNKLEFGEQCDDGNTTNFDGCSSTCIVEFCGNGMLDTIPANSTLFSENFESIGNGTITTNSTIVSTTGYSLFYENTDPTGRARYGTTAVQSNGGAGAITMDVNPSGTFVQNYLIFEIDLTSAASATDLALSFDFSHHGEESHVTDRVWIRGSNTDLWIEIYDRDANKGAAGTYTSVTNLDIDATLYANSQYPSSTFQIRFGQEDNFPASTTTVSDGLSIDNVLITGTPAGPLSDEACDDNNLFNDDGCNQSCGIENGRECTGEPSVCTLIPVPSGLQLHYDGSFAGGLFTDISGNGFNGTRFNTVTTGNQNGEIVICFNGTNQYIERATNLATSYPITMSTWMQSNTISGLRGMMSFARSTSTNRMRNLEHNGTTLRARGQNTTARYANASTTLNTSEWFLVTAVFNGNTSRDIYINGIYEGTNTLTATYSSNNNNRLNIGRLADSSPSNYFNGCLDDVRFYTTALTSGQIYNLYAKPAALTTSFTTSGSPQLTGTIQGPLDTITLTISGNVYTGTNNGTGGRSLSGGIISPTLPSGTYPTILTVTNPYGRSVTYNTSFIVNLPPVPSGDFCIASPSSLNFPQITTESYAQTGFVSSSGYFEIIDSSGVDSGYYTTLQITNLSGSTTTIPNSDLAWQSTTGITLLSGTANTGVVLGSAFSSWSSATGTVTFIKRDPAVNSGKKGTYGAILDLRLSLPAFVKPDIYTGTITYTLYEN